MTSIQDFGGRDLEDQRQVISIVQASINDSSVVVTFDSIKFLNKLKNSHTIFIAKFSKKFFFIEFWSQNIILAEMARCQAGVTLQRTVCHNYEVKLPILINELWMWWISQLMVIEVRYKWWCLEYEVQLLIFLNVSIVNLIIKAKLWFWGEAQLVVP